MKLLSRALGKTSHFSPYLNLLPKAPASLLLWPAAALLELKDGTLEDLLRTKRAQLSADFLRRAPSVRSACIEEVVGFLFCTHPHSTYDTSVLRYLVTCSARATILSTHILLAMLNLFALQVLLFDLD